MSGLITLRAESCQTADVSQPVSLSLVDSAHIEFQSCLQLLVERARFLTGAAGVSIALRSAGEFAYQAASGDSVPEPGALVETGNEAIHRCLETRQPVFSSQAAGRFALTVPILIGEAVGGFFRLQGKREFDDRDLDSLTRLAELVSVAVEQREAAEHAESLLREPDEVPEPPVAWHASDAAAAASAPKADAQQKSAAVAVGEVHSCVSCGFPVSPGRRLCVECELKPGVRSSPPAELFAVAEKQESWLSAYGYTIASLLVTALTAALILWLRR